MMPATRSSKLKIGMLTGGGDCPGLNAVIRAVAKTAMFQYDGEVIGFLDGFEGLAANQFVNLSVEGVSNILTQGGTILGSASRGKIFKMNQPGHQHLPASSDKTQDCVKTFKHHNLDCLICIGGDGTLTLAEHLSKYDVPVVGVPKTIDNDIFGTDTTFGFDTAVAVAANAVDSLRSTAASHHRAMVIEVMGRNAGWIALYAGVASGGDVILIPEMPYTLEAVAKVATMRSGLGRGFTLIVVAEGAFAAGGEPVRRPSGRLGGVAEKLADDLEAMTGIECRAVLLGHLQRGGAPTAFDRLLATRLGYAAIQMAAAGRYGLMAAVRGNEIVGFPLSELAGKCRNVPCDHPLIEAARAVGTSFGTPAAQVWGKENGDPTSRTATG